MGIATDPLAFFPDGRRLICTTEEGQCCILDVALDTLHKSPNRSGRGHVYFPIDDHDPLDPPSMRFFSAWSAAFDPTGTRLALASYFASYIIDIETGNILLNLDGSKMRRMSKISFSPDGRLVLGVIDWINCSIWDAFTRTELSHLKGHSHGVVGARFSPCRKYVVSASTNETVRLWRTSDGSCLATLSSHAVGVTHLALSPDGKTLSSADRDGRVIIRRMHDIILPIDTQNDPPLVTAPSPLSDVDPTSHLFPLPDSCSKGIPPDEETGLDELRPTAEREKVSKPEEQCIEGGSASSGSTGTCIERDEEDDSEESVLSDSPINQRATPRPTAHNGDVSTSSARLSSVTVVERRALGVRGRLPAFEVGEDANGAVPPQAPTTAGQENKMRTEGNCNTMDSGRSGLREPIVGVSMLRGEDGDKIVEGDSPAVDGANLDKRTSPETCETAIEDLPTRAALPSLLTPIERRASMNRGRSPTLEVQADTNSRGLVHAAPTGEQETTMCSDSVTAGGACLGLAYRSSSGDSTMSSVRLSALFPPEHAPLGVQGRPSIHEAQEAANSEDQLQVTVKQGNTTYSNSAATSDGCAGSAHRSNPGDWTMSSARLSSPVPAECEALGVRGQRPPRKASEDTNDTAQEQATSAGEQRDLEGLVLSPIASMVNRAANKPERRSKESTAGLCANPGRIPVPQEDSRRQGKLVRWCASLEGECMIRVG